MSKKQGSMVDVSTIIHNSTKCLLLQEKIFIKSHVTNIYILEI